MTIKLSSLAVSPSCVPVPDMADSDRIVDFDWELQSMRGTFSQLLFADDLVGLEVESSSAETTNLGNNPSYLSPYSKQDLPKMLSFGNLQEGGNEARAVPADSAGRRTDPKKSTSSCSADISPKCLRKCKRREEELVQSSSSSIVSTAPIENRKGSKRSKIENAPSTPNSQTKARRLGERVAALQQLVSPYGKTDTASVLHEAMGYIRFLHEQVRVLCSPYLQQFPSPSGPHEGQGNRSEGLISSSGERSLRSRGLCLIPVDCTIPVAACNGADFWSPAMCNGKLSSASPSPSPSSPHHR